ncbi:MAG: hypothetical protein VR72_11690 [Clostridiaceae bacterium BRH_c20a]|nr:MAG: hypothetical protein VR72_11690 [Clostridiaceae bacterium BRH_c20a]
MGILWGRIRGRCSGTGVERAGSGIRDQGPVWKERDRGPVWKERDQGPGVRDRGGYAFGAVYWV